MAPLLDDIYEHNWFVERKDKLFSFLPKRCCISGELIWLKKAWRIRQQDYGGYEDRWMCEREYLWKTLKDG